MSGWLSDKERQTLDLKLMKNMFVKPDFVVNKIITLQTLWTSSRRGTPFPKTQRHPLNHISKVFNFLTLVIMIHNFIYQVQGQLRPLLTKDHQGPNSTILYWPTDQYQPLLTQYYYVWTRAALYWPSIFFLAWPLKSLYNAQLSKLNLVSLFFQNWQTWFQCLFIF